MTTVPAGTLHSLFGAPPPWIMGVLNVTPDSISDGGQYFDCTKAIAHARQLHAEGAHIVDVGGESTKPGSAPISAAEELARILPVVEALVSEGIPVSVDTYKEPVARACLFAGAVMINDVSALRASPEMASTVAEFGAALVLMYSKETGPTPHATFTEREYRDVVVEVAAFLRSRVEQALAAGVQADRLLVDPGMGRFVSHNPAYSVELLARLPELTAQLRPHPVLVGISRKGFLGGESPEEKDALSQLAAVQAVNSGAACIRTHRPRLCRLFLDAANRLRPDSVRTAG